MPICASERCATTEIASLSWGWTRCCQRGLTDQLLAKIGVDTSRQRLDSTTVQSAIRGLTRLGILVEAASKFLRELKRKCPTEYSDVDSEMLRKYVERKGDGCFANTRPSESKRRLPEAAQDVFLLVEQFRNGEAAGLESYQLLQRIFEEQCEGTDDPTVPVAIRPPRSSGCDGVISPADSDALVPALDDTDSRHISPQELLADSHDGSTECLEKGESRGVKIISPAQTAKGTKQGKLTLEDYVLDDEGRVMRCPAGHAPVETSVADIRLQVLFDPIVCGACAHKDRCPTAAVGRSSPRYQYTHERVQR